MGGLQRPETDIGLDNLPIRVYGAESFGRIDQLHRCGDDDLAVPGVASGEESGVPIACSAIQNG